MVRASVRAEGPYYSPGAVSEKGEFGTCPQFDSAVDAYLRKGFLTVMRADPTIAGRAGTVGGEQAHIGGAL